MKTNNYIIDFLIDTYNTNDIDDQDIKAIVIEHETSLLKFKEQLNKETFKKIESIIRLKEYSKFEEFSKSERRKFFDNFIDQLDKYEKFQNKKEGFNQKDCDTVSNFPRVMPPEYNPYTDPNHPLYGFKDLKPFEYFSCNNPIHGIDKNDLDPKIKPFLQDKTTALSLSVSDLKKAVNIDSDDIPNKLKYDDTVMFDRQKEKEYPKNTLSQSEINYVKPF